MSRRERLPCFAKMRATQSSWRALLARHDAGIRNQRARTTSVRGIAATVVATVTAHIPRCRPDDVWRPRRHNDAVNHDTCQQSNVCAHCQRFVVPHTCDGACVVPGALAPMSFRLFVTARCSLASEDELQPRLSDYCNRAVDATTQASQTSRRMTKDAESGPIG